MPFELPSGCDMARHLAAVLAATCGAFAVGWKTVERLASHRIGEAFDDDNFTNEPRCLHD